MTAILAFAAGRYRDERHSAPFVGNVIRDLALPKLDTTA